MAPEITENIVPIAVMRMAGFPVNLIDIVRLGDIDQSQFNIKVLDLRQKLCVLFSENKDLQEAIWISSDTSYKGLRQYKFRTQRNSEAKNFERLLTKYLFRLCYKNDTNSFFGPSCYVRLNATKSSSIEGIVGDEIADRKNTDTHMATWAYGIPQELMREYNLARGVEEKRSIIEKILKETKGENMHKNWRWYNEKSPVYELCPANVDLTISGKLLDNISQKSLSISRRFRTFNAMMYRIAVNKGFYTALYQGVYGQIKSNKLEEWFNLFYSDELNSLKHIKEEMTAIGKRLFQQIFLEDNLSLDNEMPRLKSSPFFSPDVMIDSKSMEEINKGNYQLIMGDMHGSLTCFQKPPSCYYNNPTFISSIRLLNEYIFNRINFYFPKQFIPDTFDVPPSFNIKKDIKELQLYIKGKEICLNDSNAYIEFFYNDLLAKVIPLGAFHLDSFYPDLQERLIVDDIILKRTSCKIISQEYLDTISHLTQGDKTNWYALFQETKQFFNEKGLGGVIFVKPDCEYKPLAIDLDNPFCCEVLQSYAKKSKTMEFQEMLPGRDGLWLKNNKGNYTSELRFSFYEGRK